MSALSFFAFLLSQEMQREFEDNKVTPIKDLLDTKYTSDPSGPWDNDPNTVSSNAHKSSAKTNFGAGAIENPTERNRNIAAGGEQLRIGADICKILINLFIAFSYAKPLKKSRQWNDKDLILVALTNLLCISTEAKKQALAENFPSICLMVLKETYVKLNSISVQTFKSQNDRGQKVLCAFYEGKSGLSLSLSTADTEKFPDVNSFFDLMIISSEKLALRKRRVFPRARARALPPPHITMYYGPAINILALFISPFLLQAHPLLQEIDSIYIMLMNFMYDSVEAKEIFAGIGLADIIHKLWAYTSLNKKVLITTLKMMSTFTSGCLEGIKATTRTKTHLPL